MRAANDLLGLQRKKKIAKVKNGRRTWGRKKGKRPTRRWEAYSLCVKKKEKRIFGDTVGDRLESRRESESEK